MIINLLKSLIVDKETSTNYLKYTLQLNHFKISYIHEPESFNGKK